MKYEPHPLAELFPMMTGGELKELAADIAANGLRDNIWRYEGKVLDGRNRLAACELADVDPRFQDYTGSDPLGFVISKNLHRRHLTESQRAAVAARLANMEHGGDRRSGQAANLPNGQPAVSQAKAAELLNVSERSVRDAKHVQQDGIPELAAAVDAGEVTVSAAAEVAKLPKSEQKKVVAKGPKAVKDAAKKQRKKKPTAGTPTPDPSTNQRASDGPASGDGGTPDADPFSSAIPVKEAKPDDPPFDPRFMPNAEESVKIAATFKNLVARLRAVRTDLRGLKLDRNHPIAKRIDMGETDAYLGQVIETLDKNIPAHVCPVCCGTGDKEPKVRCDICDGYGVVDSHCHGGTKPKWKKNAARLAELTAAAERGDAA